MPQPPPSLSNDCFLQALAQARQGSQEAAGKLIDSYREYLLAISNHELPEALRAKVGDSDLAQEAILEAFENFRQFRGETEAEFLVWLRQILHSALNTFIRAYRDSRKRQVSRERPLHDAEGRAAFSLPGGQSPEAELSRQEDAIALELAVILLPQCYQEVLKLRFKDRLSFRETGSQMGISEEAARKLCVRALGELGKHLKGPSHTMK